MLDSVFVFQCARDRVVPPRIRRQLDHHLQFIKLALDLMHTEVWWHTDNAEVEKFSAIDIWEDGLICLFKTWDDKDKLQNEITGKREVYGHSRIRVRMARASLTSFKKWACSLTPGTLKASCSPRHQTWIMIRKQCFSHSVNMRLRQWQACHIV
jgi:hypothetical protein